MSGRRPSFPETLRASGATDLERRLLEGAASELPSPELSQRMARAIGVSGGAIAGRGADPGVGGRRPPWHWISIGVATTVVSGLVAVLGVAGGLGSARAPSRTAAPPLPQSPPVVADESQEAPGSIPSAAVEPSARGASPPIPARVSTGTPVDDIAGQIALLDAARAALSDGSAGRALAHLEQYEGRYPAGSFRPEAVALRIEALSKLGRTGEARGLAARFLAEHRDGPLADRVARQVGLPAP